MTSGILCLAVLRIAYSEGSAGVLFISCNVGGEGTPASVFEGITVSKDFVDYRNRHNPRRKPHLDSYPTIGRHREAVACCAAASAFSRLLNSEASL
jgi:hypothetical protein